MSVMKSVTKIITGHKQLEGGGFQVRRPLGGAIQYWDPLLLLDHFGPVVHKPGEAVGAPDHPHRGFETVTYIVDGAWDHHDSRGNKGHLRAGWVQWMTAGSGLVHAEMPSKEIMKNGGLLEGFQLWVNLPQAQKMCPPRYQDTPADKIPVVEEPNVRVKVIAGEYKKQKAFIETRTPILYLDVWLNSGRGEFDVEVAPGFNMMTYCYRGNGKIQGADVVLGQAVFMDEAGDVIRLLAKDGEARFLLIGGKPFGEPIQRHGPIVMTTSEEINEAFMDYRQGKFGDIAGSEERYSETKKALETQKKNKFSY